MKLSAIPGRHSYAHPRTTKKLLQVMKLVTILLFAACLQVAARTEGQMVSLSLKNAPMKQVFREIHKQTGLNVMIDERLLEKSGTVTIQVRNVLVDEALRLCLRNAQLSYVIEGSAIVVKEQPVALLRPDEQLPVPPIKVSGVVTDENGQVLSGVSVTIKGTNLGTSTNGEGGFSIEVNAGQKLVFSIVGYKNYSVTVDGRSANLQVSLVVEAAGLQDMVVVGYGSQKKINMSGAVESVSGKDLANRPISNVNEGLQGLIGNLNIAPANGRATTTPDFNIRGFTSINGGNAFILVDNIPATADEVGRLNPADIAGVSVLKDAASAAIYGARAAFGVVLITTKTAKSDKLMISANSNFAIRTIGSTPDIVTDPLTVMQYKHDAATPLYDLYPDAVRVYAAQRSKDPSLPAAIVDPTNPNAWAYYGSTNWLKEAYNSTAPATTSNISIAKRDKKLSYYLSGGYYRQDGLLRYGNDVLTRYNLRSNATYQATNWLKIGNNTAYTYSTYNSPNFIDGLFFWNVNRTPSLSIPRNPDGSWTSDGAAILGTLQQGGRKIANTSDLLTTFNTEVTLVKDMWAVKGDATFRRTNTPTQSYNLPIPYRTGPGQPFGYQLAGGSGGNSYAANETNIANQNVFNVYTDFHHTFGTKHFVQALAGFNQEYRYWNDYWVKRTGLITQSLPNPQLATGTITQQNTIADWAVQGEFFRLNYIYNDKYIVEFNGRRDGSSHYPANDRWGFFPSASAAWVISKERFFEPVAKSIRMDLFKIRGSYGALGNQVTSTDPSLNNYPYIPTMSSGAIGQILDGSLPIAVYQPAVVSSSLTWENVKTVNGGVDMAFLNDKLELTGDIYTRYTDNMLTKSKTLPAVFGAGEPQTNAANLKTSGWELSLSYHDQVMAGNSPLHFSARFILANSRTHITRYDNPTQLLTDYYKGQRLGEIWGFINDGYFKSDNEVAASPDQTAVGEDDQQYKFYAGDVKFKDLNHDGKIDFGDNTVAKPGDRKVIGNSTAQYPFGLDLKGDWKGFDLRVFVQGVGKRDWYPTPSNIYFWGIYAQPWTNVTKQNMNHWTPQHPNAYFPALRAYIAEDAVSPLTVPQTSYLQNAAYMRLKNITLGYSLPQSLMNKWKINQLRFYVSGENIFTVKHMKVNMDPEGLDNSSKGDIYPFQKTYSFGMNLNF